MVKAGRARSAAIVGVLASTMLGSAIAAEQNAPPKDASTKAEAPAGKPRTGLKIELTVPAIPGLGKGSNPDTAGKSWPKTIPESQAEKDAKSKPPAQWTPQEIAEGRARCEVILKRIHAIAIPQDPIKEGLCGAPAPVQLISLGQDPQVALDPPATVNCDFAESLQNWLEQDVQPLAQKHLGGRVIKMEIMSSYSCRNAYGRAGNKLSEHGIANALDIRGFVTSTGKTAYVLEDWGTPQREILARIAAEKEKAAKAQAAQEAAAKAAQAAQATSKKPPVNQPPAATASTSGGPAAGIARSTISEGIPRLTITLPGANPTVRESFSLSPSRLGGPKPPDETAATSKYNSEAAPMPAKPKGGMSDSERKEAFLHAVHNSACQRFGTTLGPEANAAHRNHLHVDMAQRKVQTKICDR